MTAFVTQMSSLNWTGFSVLIIHQFGPKPGPSGPRSQEDEVTGYPNQ